MWNQIYEENDAYFFKSNTDVIRICNQEFDYDFIYEDCFLCDLAPKVFELEEKRNCKECLLIRCGTNSPYSKYLSGIREKWFDLVDIYGMV